MEDKFQALTTIEVGGATYTLQLTWADIIPWEEEFGPVKWIDEKGQTVAGSIDMVAAALSHHHPELTAEAIRNSAFPFRAFAPAIGKVISYLYNGPDAPKSASETTEKKRILADAGLAEDRVPRGHDGAAVHGVNALSREAQI